MKGAERELRSNRIELKGSIEEVYDYVCRQGWGDGLPIIPPTEERVWRFIDYLGRKPDEILGEMPPADGEVTIEKIAINAVMAGCLPEYMPVLIAAVEAMLEPEFGLTSVQATTNPVAPLAVINGPIRHQLGINCGRGCLGPGWRSNATIGRAIRLMLINVGGAVPDVADKAILGMPGKYSFCIGEDEEGSAWEPLHVERGFERDASAVTMIPVQDTRNCVSVTPNPRNFLVVAANAMATVGCNHMMLGGGQPVVILTRGHVAVLAGAGLSKADCKRIVHENARAPLSAFLDVRLAGNEPLTVNGMALATKDPDDIILAVAGAPETYHLQVMASFGRPRKAVTKLIRADQTS